MKPEAPTAQDILDEIIAGQKVPAVIEKGETELVLPEVPEGCKIEITKVNPEGIIALDGTVTTPETVSYTHLQSWQDIL